MYARPLSSRHTPSRISKRAAKRLKWNAFWKNINTVLTETLNPKAKEMAEDLFIFNDMTIKEVMYDLFRTYMEGRSAAQVEADMPRIQSELNTIVNDVINTAQRKIFQEQSKAAYVRFNKLNGLLKSAASPRGRITREIAEEISPGIGKWFDDIFETIAGKAARVGVSTHEVSRLIMRGKNALMKTRKLQAIADDLDNMLGRTNSTLMTDLVKFRFFDPTAPLDVAKIEKAIVKKVTGPQKQKKLLKNLIEVKRAINSQIDPTMISPSSLRGAKNIGDIQEQYAHITREAQDKLNELDEALRVKVKELEEIAPAKKKTEELEELKRNVEKEKLETERAEIRARKGKIRGTRIKEGVKFWSKSPWMLVALLAGAIALALVLDGGALLLTGETLGIVSTMRELRQANQDKQMTLEEQSDKLEEMAKAWASGQRPARTEAPVAAPAEISPEEKQKIADAKSKLSQGNIFGARVIINKLSDLALNSAVDDSTLGPYAKEILELRKNR